MKKRFSESLRRYPWLARLIIRVYRVTRTRYSAGVVGVLLNAEGQILLVEHIFHPKTPWGLPGGWVERREEPADTVCREWLEETGLRVRIVRPLLIRQARRWRNHLDIAYLLEAESPLDTITLSSELTGYGWYALDDMPRLGEFNAEVVAIVAQLLQQEVVT